MLRIIPPIDMNGYDIAALDPSRRFDNGKMAVQAYCSDGDMALMVSVNLPESAHMLDKGEFFRDRSRILAPILSELLKRGIIEIVAGKSAPTGYVVAPVARLKEAK